MATNGHAVDFTEDACMGEANMGEAGQYSGEGFTCQANMMRNDTVWATMAHTFEQQYPAHSAQCAPVQDSAHKSRLACVLEIIADDTEKSNGERDRRRPMAIDNAVEVGVGETRKIAHSVVVHVVVVTNEPVSTDARHQGDIGGRVAVAGRCVLERKAESFGPATRGPGLLGARDLSDMVVLDATEMPQQPSD